MATVTRFVITETGQAPGVTRAHGRFVYHVTLPGIDRHSCIWGTITEIAGAPGEPIDFPFVGDANMAVLNVAPKDDGVVDVVLQVDWNEDLNCKVQLIRADV